MVLNSYSVCEYDFSKLRFSNVFYLNEIELVVIVLNVGLIEHAIPNVLVTLMKHVVAVG